MRHQLYKACVQGVELQNYNGRQDCCLNIPRKNHWVSLAVTLKWSVGPKLFFFTSRKVAKIRLAVSESRGCGT